MNKNEKCPTCKRPLASRPLWLIATVETAIITAASIGALWATCQSFDNEWWAVAAVASAAAGGKIGAPSVASKVGGGS